MRVRDRLLMMAESAAGALMWGVSSFHLRTDPACAEYVAPKAGSRLDRTSRGYTCTRCMRIAAFDMTADTDPALDGDRELIRFLRENAEHLGWDVRESPDSPRQPQPGDGPDYHAEHAAWRNRRSPDSGSDQ